MAEVNNFEEEWAQDSQAYAVKFIKPAEIIEEIGVGLGEIVADFGCGGGYFSLPVAEKIGENGIVYALDILPQSLEMIAGYAKTKGLNNIITRRVNLEKEGGSKLDDNSCDWVIMKDMLFQNKSKDTIIGEAKRVVKNGGRILIIEWNKDDASIGPEKSLRVSKESLMEIIQDLGLTTSSEISVSDFHYGLVLIK